jgi:hypothetical protein
MRMNILFWALATGIAFPTGLFAQDNGTVLSHNSTEAVSMVLAHQVELQLSPAQLEHLKELQSTFAREQTRFVLVGWKGAPGKNATPRYEKIRVAPRLDRYIQTRASFRIRAFDRVPGKAVPRLIRNRVIQLVERPCPFAFLEGSQLDLVHGLLARI